MCYVYGEYGVCVCVVCIFMFDVCDLYMCVFSVLMRCMCYLFVFVCHVCMVCGLYVLVCLRDFWLYVQYTCVGCVL